MYFSNVGAFHYMSTWFLHMSAAWPIVFSMFLEGAAECAVLCPPWALRHGGLVRLASQLMVS